MNTNPDVDAFLAERAHPMTAAIQALREIILRTDPRLAEHIKWNAPSYQLDGEDRITFNLAGKGFFRLIFHCGAKKRPQPLPHRLIDAPAGLLDWPANDRAVAKFTGTEDVEGKKDALVEVIRAWLAKS